MNIVDKDKENLSNFSEINTSPLILKKSVNLVKRNAFSSNINTKQEKRTVTPVLSPVKQNISNESTNEPSFQFKVITTPISFQHKQIISSPYPFQNDNQTPTLKRSMKRYHNHSNKRRHLSDSQNGDIDILLEFESDELKVDLIDKKNCIKTHPDPTEPVDLTQLISHLLFGQKDENILESFTLSYKHFSITPKDKFKKLIQLYIQPSLKYYEHDISLAHLRLRLLRYISLWIRVSPCDFEIFSKEGNKKSMVVPINDYIEFVNIVKENYVNLERYGIHIPSQREHKSSFGWTPNVTLSNSLKVNTLSDSESFLNDADSFVNQLTYYEAKLFKNILPTELIGQAWNKHGKENNAPRLTNMIKHFNRICSWVNLEITKVQLPKDQAKIIEKYINIARKLKKIGNFNGLMEILSGLSSSSVQKLQSAWKIVSDKNISRLKKLENLMTPYQNFKEYRQKLKCTKNVIIPYIGVHLGDIVHILEGKSDERDGYYDYNKVIQLGNILLQWRNLQNQPVEIVEDTSFTNFILNLRSAVPSN